MCPQKFKLFLFLSLSLFDFAIFANTSKISLTMGEVRHYQISIERGLYGVGRRNDEIFTFARKGNFFVKSEYDSKAKEQDLAFGTLHNPLDRSERLPLASSQPRYLRGMGFIDGYLLFLDSALRQFLIWNDVQKIWHPPADIVLDLVRPAADARGEAPQAETQRLRQRIGKDFAKIRGDPELIVGMAPIPAAWQKQDGAQFLILLRLPIAGLMTVRCEGRNFSRCLAQRACPMSGLTSVEIEQAAGLALQAERQEIWIGLPKSKSIRRLSARHCLNLRSLGDISLEEDFKNLSNLLFDSENNLWVTLSEPHSARDGSLFRWDAQVIERLFN